MVALLLLLGVYVLIFRFSSDDADRSSQLSRAVTRVISKVYHVLLGGNIGVVHGEMTESVFLLEAFVRKLAHFTEYFCVGFLSYSVVRLWSVSPCKAKILVGIQVVVSASLDEFHQYFVPGRYASVWDVLIDSMGGLCGILVLGIFVMIYKRIKGYR